MPKETRPSAGSRIPDIDRTRLGPVVNRCILDLAESANGSRSDHRWILIYGWSRSRIRKRATT